MKYLGPLVLALANLVFAGSPPKQIVNCDTSQKGHLNMIQDCVKDLKAHSGDIIHLIGLGNHKFAGANPYQIACYRKFKPKEDSPREARIIVMIGHDDLSVYDVTKGAVACAAQTIVDKCYTADHAGLISGTSTGCETGDFRVDIEGWDTQN